MFILYHNIFTVVCLYRSDVETLCNVSRRATRTRRGVTSWIEDRLLATLTVHTRSSDPSTFILTVPYWLTI
jgi:hypothetical protein